MPDRPGSSRLHILVTNDDGIEAPALAVLAHHLSEAGHDVQVAAPRIEYTGCGASIGRMSQEGLIATSSVALPGAPGVPAVSVDGPPALAVLAACLGLIGPRPDIVVSGTNSGYNTGSAVLHSGTVGAAMTAAANGVPAVALSTARDAEHGYTTAAEFCARNLPTLLASLPARAALNVNVPDRPLGDLAGVRLTSLAEVGLVTVTILAEPGGLLVRRLRPDPPSDESTDAGAVAAHFVSITTIHGGVRALEPASMGEAAWDHLLVHPSPGHLS